MKKFAALISLFLFGYINMGGIIFKLDPNIQQKDFYGTGYIIDKNGTMGSCVSIYEGEWVITAAHVLQNSHDNFYTVKFPYDDPYEYVITSVYINAKEDVALCRLNRPVPKYYAISFNKPLMGKVIYAAGYGLSSSISTPERVVYQYGKVDLTVFKNTTDAIINIDNVDSYLYDISCPELDSTLKGEGILGPGDSGGGIFKYVQGKPVLIGISNMIFAQHDGSVHINPIGCYIPLNNVEEWIKNTIPPIPTMEYY